MYKYGMRIRGFSIGAQPMEGFIRREESPYSRYWDILCYDRRLTDDELKHFSLDFISEDNGIKA